MTDVPVKIECKCGSKLEFTVQHYKTAVIWMAEFWQLHAGCLGQQEPMPDKITSNQIV